MNCKKISLGEVSESSNSVRNKEVKKHVGLLCNLSPPPPQDLWTLFWGSFSPWTAYFGFFPFLLIFFIFFKLLLIRYSRGFGVLIWEGGQAMRNKRCQCQLHLHWVGLDVEGSGPRGLELFIRLLSLQTELSTRSFRGTKEPTKVNGKSFVCLGN